MEKNEALEILKKKVMPCLGNSGWSTAVQMAIEALQAEPERKKGEWKFEHQRTTKAMFSDTKVTCNKCGYRKSRADGEILNYCPNCGADMRKPKLQYGDEDTLQGGLMSAT